MYCEYNNEIYNIVIVAIVLLRNVGEKKKSTGSLLYILPVLLYISRIYIYISNRCNNYYCASNDRRCAYIYIRCSSSRKVHYVIVSYIYVLYRVLLRDATSKIITDSEHVRDGVL